MAEAHQLNFPLLSEKYFLSRRWFSFLNLRRRLEELTLQIPTHCYKT